MSKKKPPAFQFYPKDFLAGTADMSPTEVGAYIRLLCYAWDQSPIGSLPAEDERLRRIAGSDASEWSGIRESVLSKFKFVEKEERYFNERLVAERLKQTQHSEKASNRGKKGAEARWHKDDASNA